MTRRVLTSLILLGISVLLLTIPAFWFSYPLLTDFFNPGAAAGELNVSFLDIGQGDATLIRTPYSQNILIDGGPDRTILARLSEELPWWERTIDLVILTHPHDDHVGGLIGVLERYSVERILYTGVIHTSPTYLKWLELIRDKDISLTIIDHPQTITLGEGLELQIFYPLTSFSGESVEELNNTSIVTKLNYGQNSFLFTGDAEEEVEAILIKQNFNLEPQVLQAGHHGSITSNTEEFAEEIKPDFVVMSLGKDNQFGHPSGRVVKRFERMGVKILRTDELGTIKFSSNGEEIKIINP